ncbi:DEAD/DEAH box helicase [Marinihelvus fidelis]|uniref:DEAD/DEAH box helicase n=1 Tax=Marinihelvus fidelis TaxID=2613842 RepID=A0A5N0TCH4_9GAMM|nr:DEAD/DEAH box helicase [Marinihelvus fidelis]KAA9131546.1 DEAD/DEAH box helicase [Marinihelvus fidelis]
MSFSENDFLQNLANGFVDRRRDSSREFLPRLLTNNREESRKVLTSLERQLVRCKSFQFSVAFITTSGVASLINALDTLRVLGVRGKILASQYQNFTQPEALRRLLHLPNIDLRISVEHNFHAKGYLFERANQCWSLIVGSSNLTANALSKNAEWNLHVSALEDSALLEQTRREFDYEFQRGIPVDHAFIEGYESVYFKAQAKRALVQPFDPVLSSYPGDIQDGEAKELRRVIQPNQMQKAALANLDEIRQQDLTRALLVSATGTGKTFLSAFDAEAFGAKKLLFVVHRRNIAEAAMASYQEVHGQSRTMGLYSGEVRDFDRDFVFCTVQTLSKPENLRKFFPTHFDYIVIDETHRAGATSYQAVIDYFRPRFLLGMTATPERTDGYDVFSLFDHTIAYEIRLHQALEEEMLCPFHYYGVTDLAINDQLVDESTDFNLLTSEERVSRILEKTAFYGTDSGEVRGLVFCSRTDECKALAAQFRARGVRAIALTGEDSESARVEAIHRLESEDPADKLDYIFTVDIFNEGVDIPRVNQVVMLRPTQSAIVFVQQMGRGLRKTGGKEYLTIIDFIGNYTNNFLVPIALYGDHSYNKDRLRKLLNDGSRTLPGTSTINFDLISKKRIYSAIDTANMQRLKDLRKDYELLKFQLGRAPMMMDFIEHGSRDPYLYVDAKKSFFHFAETQEDTLKGALTPKQKLVQEKFSKEINNGVRAEESMLLLAVINNGVVDLTEFKRTFTRKYGDLTDAAIDAAINGLNLRFVRAKKDGKMLPVGEILGFQAVERWGSSVRPHPDLLACLAQPVFKKYLIDNIEYSMAIFDAAFAASKMRDGFQLYKKYSRKDVFRILNWETNPVAQNVGGYIVSEDGTNCPIFVTYHKSEGISESTNYEDYFINNLTFAWMSKSNRRLDSNDVLAIRNARDTGMRMPLFIKKSDDEGADFYFVGDLEALDDSFEQATISNDKGKLLPVVKVQFRLSDPVEDSLYDYFTHDEAH